MQKLDFLFGPEECLFLLFQFGLIVCVLLGWGCELRWPRRQPSMSACLLAIFAGLSCRLAGMFVMVSAGFNYIQSDDPSRWIKAWGWIHHPKLYTGVWPTGTSLFHGLAMGAIGDPLVASKLVAILFCLLSLVGIFIFTMGVFANRWLACAAVLAGAVQWLNIYLSTGAMSEIPTVAFMLSGIGMLLLGLRRPAAGRFGWLAAAALLFILGTMFHTTAWMQLAAILIALLIYALSRWGRANGFDLGHWLIFSLASTLFCVVYCLACWQKEGNPLNFIREYSTLLVRDHGHLSLIQRLYTYPLCLAYTYQAALPLLGFGIVWSWCSKEGERQVRRVALLAAGLTMLIYIGSTLNGAAPARTGHRSVIILSTALIPFMLAPFFSIAGDRSDGGAPPVAGAPGPARRLAFWGFLAVSALFFLHHNYRNAMERVANFGSDNVAVGAWLRQEMIEPRVLKPADLTLPVWIHRPVGANFNIYPLLGEVRFIDRIALGDNVPIESLRHGQIVVSPEPIGDPRMQTVTKIGSIFVYRFHGGQEKHPRKASGKGGKPKDD